ncbi:pectin lyase fold/virulence factor, partial [Baffinella frigidus]
MRPLASPRDLFAAARPARSATRALLLLALALAAAAVELHVDPAGEWAGQVEGAGSGVVVVFAPGRYGGCSAGGLALANGVALVGAAGAADSVIDCGGSGRHFAVTSGASVRIERLTLTGGAAAGANGNGGCVLVEGPGGSVVVADSVFSNCSAVAWGGAIAVRGRAALNISRSNFTGNRAGEGGGAINVAASTLNVSSSRFEWNTANGAGGALCASGGSRVSME